MRGRGKTAKGRGRVDEILDAAEAVLREEGHGGLSLRQIAERCGLALSHVQYYFDGRGALLGALFDRSLDACVADLEQRSPSGDLQQAAQFVLDEQLVPGKCLMFRELWALAGRDAEVEAQLAAYYRRYLAHIEGLLSGRRPGRDGLRASALVIVSLLEGASLFRSFGPGARSGVSLARLDREVLRACRLLAGTRGRRQGGDRGTGRKAARGPAR